MKTAAFYDDTTEILMVKHSQFLGTAFLEIPPVDQGSQQRRMVKKQSIVGKRTLREKVDFERCRPG
jgi:hypothetical protein